MKVTRTDIPFQKTTRWLLIIYCLSCVALFSCVSRSRDMDLAGKSSPRPDVELSSTVSRAEAGVSDPVYFRVTLEAAPEVSLSPPEVGSMIEGFRILDMGTEGPKSIEGRRWSQQWFKLQADLAGSYLLPAVKVPYTDNEGNEHLAEAPQIFVEIKSALDPTAEEQDIRDIKPLEKMERQLPKAWILLAVGGLLLGGFIVSLVIYHRQRRLSEEIRLPPEELARKELQDLEATGLFEEERYREYVFTLSLIFRRYLERKFLMPAAEQTTEELLLSLRKEGNLEETLKKMARAFIEETDPIKYTGLDPRGEDTEELRLQLISFLEKALETADTGIPGEEEAD